VITEAGTPAMHLPGLFVAGILAEILILVDCVADPKYYKLLEVRPGCSDAELKKSYRKLALRWHPDKQVGKSDAEKDQAEEKFKEISQAYDTLSDPEKRKIYDQVGEEGVKRGEGGGERGGHRGQADPFTTFEEFFAQGHGGFSFQDGFFQGFGQQRRPPLFADREDAITMLQKPQKLQSLLKEARSDINQATKQFVAVLYHERSRESKALKDAVVKAGKSYSGALPLYAVECGERPDMCKLLHEDVQSFPMLIYYGYGNKFICGPGDDGEIVGTVWTTGIAFVDSIIQFWSSAYQFLSSLWSNGADSPSNGVTEKGINRWLPKVLPERIVYLESLDALDLFLSADPAKAKIVFLTEKTSVPPRLKTLSMDYGPRVSVAAVHTKTAPDVAAKLIDRPISSLSLPVFYDAQTAEIAHPKGPELRAYFIAAIRAHQTLQKAAKFEELTLAQYEAGICDGKDSNFCFLIIFPTREESKAVRTAEFSSLAGALKNKESEPLRLLYFALEVSGRPSAVASKLDKLLAAASVTSSKIGVLLWRPKRRRFETFEGDWTNRAEVVSFVRMAIDSGRMLAKRHDEL